MSQANLLSNIDCNIKWKLLTKNLASFNENWETDNDEIAALHQGYAPISIRSVEKIVQGESQNILRFFKEAGINVTKRGSTERIVEGNVLVVFIGGSTYSEVNTLRRISNETLKYLVLTTNMMGTKDFFTGLSHGIPNWSPNF